MEAGTHQVFRNVRTAVYLVLGTFATEARGRNAIGHSVGWGSPERRRRCAKLCVCVLCIHGGALCGHQRPRHVDPREQSMGAAWARKQIALKILCVPTVGSTSSLLWRLWKRHHRHGEGHASSLIACPTVCLRDALLYAWLRKPLLCQTALAISLVVRICFSKHRPCSSRNGARATLRARLLRTPMQQG